MGAIASGGIRVLNDDVVGALKIPERVIEAVASQELQELRWRERSYRGNRPPLEIVNHTVILVDNGMATGSTMKAAIEALRRFALPASSLRSRPAAPVGLRGDPGRGRRVYLLHNA